MYFQIQILSMIEIKNHQYFRQEKWAWHALDSATPMSFDIFILIVVISLCINQIDIVGVVYSWFSDCHAPLLQYSEFSSSNSLNIFKVFIYRVNNQRVMTAKLLKHHCYKNSSPNIMDSVPTPSPCVTRIQVTRFPLMR